MAAFIFDGFDDGIAYYPDGVYSLDTEFDKREDTPNLNTSTNMLVGAPVSGTATPNLPIATSYTGSFSGFLFNMYRPDYYERVHVIPGTINLGSLLTSQSRDVEVFNGYLSQSRDLANIIGSGTTDGIVITEPQPAPTTFLPLESREYNVAISTTGPPEVNATYTFDFDTEDPTLVITGARTQLFTFEPNWDEPVRETLSWLTNILESHNGDEQAISLRSIPRRSFSFQVAEHADARRLLEGYMFKWKSRIYGLPIWSDCDVLQNTLGSGSSAIPMTIDTGYMSYTVGGLVIIIDDVFNAEALEILTIDQYQLNLKNPTTQAWAAGSRVYPVYTARLLDQQVVTYPTDDMLIGTFDFELDANNNVTAVDSATTYQSLTVLEDKADRSEDPGQSWQGKIEIVDFNTGGIAVDIKAELPDFVGQNYRFLLKGDDEAWRWRQWLHARKGRAIPFWFSSQQSDFRLLDTIGATATQLSVYDAQYRVFYEQSFGKRDFVIELWDGTKFYRRITGSAAGVAGKETIDFDTSLGQEVTVDDVKMFSFLHPVRLDSDSIEITWYTDDIFAINLNMRGMRI